MSFLVQIDRIKAEGADPKDILDHSMAQTEMFGIRTVAFRQADFEGFTDESRLESIKEKTGFILEHYRSEQRKYAFSRARDDSEAVNRSISQTTQTIYGKAWIGYFQGYGDFADRYNADAYPDPYYGIVIAPPKIMTANNFAHFVLQKELEPLPSIPDVIQAKAVWHEYAHVTGAGEPQADAISTVLCKRAFNNVAYQEDQTTKIFSDLRAVNSVFRFDREDDYNTKYGWPMVEANDYIDHMPQSLIQNFTEAQIKNIRFQQFDPLEGYIYQIGSALRREAKKRVESGTDERNAFIFKDFKPLADMVDDVAQEGYLQSKEKQQILKRFQLAVLRLEHGAQAYGAGNGLISEDIQNSEKNQPITFTPGAFIPEIPEQG